MHGARRWDIFCKVVDNYGDAGVCWRVAADLASRGHEVRLWIDEPDLLQWMAPGAVTGAWPGIRVLHWDLCRDLQLLASLPPADIWVEGFGCDIPAEFVAHRFRGSDMTSAARSDLPMAWINLEYLSAEGYVERSHGLPSPLMHGPARGYMRHFFYPGFTPRTGGLLREPALTARRAAFARDAWLAGQGIPWQGESLVSLFCYEPPALKELLTLLRSQAQPTRLLVTHGRAAAAVRQVLGSAPRATGRLAFDFLAPLAQADFDHLLWSCDVNFVRGEDSLVRALWAGKAFVWQIYPQHDDAHHAKLMAVLDALAASDGWRRLHGAWNGMAPWNAGDWKPAAWEATALAARAALEEQSDLCSRLLSFVEGLPGVHRIRAEKG